MELDLDSRYRVSDDRRAFSSYLDTAGGRELREPGANCATSSASRLYDKYGLDNSKSYHSTSKSYSTTLNNDDSYSLSASRFAGSSALLGTRHLNYRPGSSNLDLGPTIGSSLYRSSALDRDYLDSDRRRLATTTTTTTTSEAAAAATTTATTLSTRPSGVYFTTTTTASTSLGPPLTTTAMSSCGYSASSGVHSSALDKLITSSSLSNVLGYNRDSQLGGSSSPGFALPSYTTSRAKTDTSATTSRLLQQIGANNSTDLATPGANYSSATTIKVATPANPVLQQMFEDMRLIEDTVDSLEIPARGRCKVFMAKYGYDPFKESPNDEPDKELAFNAGDYIMVFSDIDEDGYFIGELLDGRRGYVPSNWLERVTGEDLFEFQASILYQTSAKPMSTAIATTTTTTTGALGTNNSGAFGVAGDQQSQQLQMDATTPGELYDRLMMADSLGHSNFQHLLLAPEDYHRMNDYVDLDDVNEIDDECLSDYERAEAEQMRRAVPPPQRLTIERQLLKSILVSWLHPQAAKGTIVSYQLYVDGVLKSTVPRGDRTKALLEGVDSSIPHRISVRAIDYSGAHSNDAACTVVIGQGVPFAPSCVKASHITSDSALISWLPCNSNFHHVVAVNSVEVQTVKPGAYKHLINGLSADTLYRVWVRAKPGKILSCDEKNPKKLESLTTFVDFKTLAKSLPDPPVNVQVEAGPQRRSLLVTWLPLTLNDYGTSNGCPVTGYAVFAGHKKLADVDSPTGDHALLDLADLDSLHKKSVTVRTKSGENLSQDSMACQIPDEYLKSQTLDGLSSAAAARLQQQQQQQQQQSLRQLRHSPHAKPAGSRLAGQRHQQPPNQLHPNQHPGRYSNSTINRNLASRSLQNLESDADSRRSSNQLTELDQADQFGANPASLAHLNAPGAESYSEDEFESSMRLRGPLRGAGRQSRATAAAAARAYNKSRQSHSLDSTTGLPVAQLHQANRYHQQQQQLQNRDIRYFVAQFDYEPATMSPNPNAALEELAFKEGSIIKVFGDKGLDGFYRGELDNRFGFVPCNVVSEIRDSNMLYQLQEKTRLQQVASQRQQQQQQQQQAAAPSDALKRMIAMYDYDPQENSPNADTESEIAFKKGDIIYVYGKMDTDGFYMGEIERTKRRGLVPSNFLCEEPAPGQPVAFNGLDTMQPLVNKPMNANNGQQQIRANARSVQQQDQLQQQQQQLGLQPGNRLQQMGAGNQLQQQQPMAGVQQAGFQQQQPANMMAGNRQDAQQQQQFAIRGQQQQTGGVLSNLLSSGKQMIGSPAMAKTNLAGQQQQQPQLGQQQLGLQQNPMVLNQNHNQLVQPMQQVAPGQMMQQQQQQQPMLQTNGMLDGSLLATGQAGFNQLQGQQLTRAGLIAQQQQQANNQFGQNLVQDPVQLQLNQFGQQQQPQLMQPAGQQMRMPMGMATMQTSGLQQQQQQQQQVPLGMRQGQLGQQQMGPEEQGGTILNTVKNMFKL